MRNTTSPRRPTTILANLVSAMLAASACAPSASDTQAEATETTENSLTVTGPDGRPLPLVKLTYTASNGAKRGIHLYKPSATSYEPKLVFLLHGTAKNATNPDAFLAEIIRAMVGRGLTVAAVDYPNKYTEGFQCSDLGSKARAIFSPTSKTSAYTVVTQKLGLPNTTPFGASGFSQGSWVAGLAHTYNSNVRAGLYGAIGLDMTLFLKANFRACLKRPVQATPRVLAVTGESDFVFLPPFTKTSASIIRSQLRELTNACTSCTGTDGRDDSGSGWYVVRGSETTGGKASHDYMLMNGKLDPIWTKGTAPWSLGPQVDWLVRSLEPAGAELPPDSAETPVDSANSSEEDAGADAAPASIH